MDFRVFLNQKFDMLDEGSTEKWLGDFILSADYGALTKLDLFDHIKKHGYVLTARDEKKCTHYREQIRDYTELLAKNSSRQTQIVHLAKSMMSLYLEAVSQWITEKFADENRSFLSGSSVEPQKRAAVEKFRQHLTPFYAGDDSPETLEVFQAELEDFELHLLQQYTALDQVKARAWLLQEKTLREPVRIDEMDVVLPRVPSITHAADADPATLASSSSAPVTATLTAKPVFH